MKLPSISTNLDLKHRKEDRNMRYKIYTREEYLQWCQENKVKNPLPEYKRNKMTESGYPTHPYDPYF
jgi:hypothetical protein